MEHINLQYEEVEEKTSTFPATRPLINELPYQCEYERSNGTQCDNIATDEWQYIDEEDYNAGESFLYSTYRCEDHPEDHDWNPIA